MVFIYLSIHKLNFENSDGNDEFELYYKDIGLKGYRRFLIQLGSTDDGWKSSMRNNEIETNSKVSASGWNFNSQLYLATNVFFS